MIYAPCVREQATEPSSHTTRIVPCWSHGCERCSGLAVVISGGGCDYFIDRTGHERRDTVSSRDPSIGGHNGYDKCRACSMLSGTVMLRTERPSSVGFDKAHRQSIQGALC